MTTLSLNLPRSLHKQIEEMAERDGIAAEQSVSTAAAEKLAALLTVDHLEQRAKRASQEKFQAVLAQVPDVEPEEHDKL